MYFVRKITYIIHENLRNCQENFSFFASFSAFLAKDVALRLPLGSDFQKIHRIRNFQHKKSPSQRKGESRKGKVSGLNIEDWRLTPSRESGGASLSIRCRASGLKNEEWRLKISCQKDDRQAYNLHSSIVNLQLKAAAFLPVFCKDLTWKSD